MSVFLLRLVQGHTSFRLAEVEALSKYIGQSYEIVLYEENSPFCLIRLGTSCSRARACQIAADFVTRSVLSFGIYELWGSGCDYSQLHHDIQTRQAEVAVLFATASFKFSVDSFQAKRSTSEQRAIIETFSYLPFKGKIDMKNPDEEFVVFEEWPLLDPELQSRMNTGKASTNYIPPSREPFRVYLGRKIAKSQRSLMDKHDLKRRPYISTTSMDAELALVTAILALAGPGKLFLDPFVGTGGFMVAASELGAVSLGTDIDGRSFRGKGLGVMKGVGANLQAYGLMGLFADCITSDLTNTPLQMTSRWLDGIICDPPYGVREGLKVLGRRLDGRDLPEVSPNAIRVADGSYLVEDTPSHLLPGFVAPKRPYSFLQMLDDILVFASKTLVPAGRLAFWMPSANEAEKAFPIPQHPQMKLLHICTQDFNKWSRRLLVYECVDTDISPTIMSRASAQTLSGSSANALNPFRRMYFQGFTNAG